MRFGGGKGWAVGVEVCVDEGGWREEKKEQKLPTCLIQNPTATDIVTSVSMRSTHNSVDYRQCNVCTKRQFCVFSAVIKHTNQVVSIKLDGISKF